eukprot:jgi/Mesvir1/7539/Mv19285-RA.1
MRFIRCRIKSRVGISDPATPPNSFCGKTTCYHMHGNSQNASVRRPHDIYHHNAFGLESLEAENNPQFENARQLATALSSIPEEYLLLGHCLVISSAGRHLPFKTHFIVYFWVAFFTGFAGGTTTALLMQEAPSWFTNNMVMLVWTATWYAMNYLPWNLGAKIYDNLLPLRLCAQVGFAYSRSRLIVTKVNAALALYGRGAIAGPLIIGTLSGCAGKLTRDLVGRLWGEEPTHKSEMATPSWSSKSAFMGAFLYLLMSVWLPILPQDVAFTLVATLLLAHALASEILGAFDPLDAPFRALCKICLIPFPGSVASSSPKASASGAASGGAKSNPAKEGSATRKALPAQDSAATTVLDGHASSASATSRIERKPGVPKLSDLRKRK